MLKRLFDLLVAASALLLLLPLLLVLAVMVKLDSPGPVLFRQTRVGLHGREFTMFKLRTMRAGAAAGGPALTIGADPRITRLGARLRARRLDELPQLFNVLRGEMSMVGPRPEVPRYAARVPAELRTRWLALRPGITDPVSLAHANETELLSRASEPEALYVQQILPAKLRAAIAYGEQATLASDVGVLLRSLGLLLGVGGTKP